MLELSIKCWNTLNYYLNNSLNDSSFFKKQDETIFNLGLDDSHAVYYPKLIQTWY